MRALILCALLAGLPLGALAASSTSSAGKGEPPAPPPEAITACKGQSEGSEVSFSGPNGESFSGFCRLVNGTLAAMPRGGPGGSRMPPPPR